MKQLMGKLLGLMSIISALIFTAYASCSVYVFVKLIKIKCTTKAVTGAGIVNRTAFSTDAIPAILALAVTFAAATLIVLRIISENKINYVASTALALVAIIALLTLDMSDQIHSFFTTLVGMTGSDAAETTALFKPITAIVIFISEAIHMTLVIGSGALRKKTKAEGEAVKVDAPVTETEPERVVIELTEVKADEPTSESSESSEEG